VLQCADCKVTFIVPLCGEKVNSDFDVQELIAKSIGFSQKQGLRASGLANKECVVSEAV